MERAARPAGGRRRGRGAGGPGHRDEGLKEANMRKREPGRRRTGGAALALAAAGGGAMVLALGGCGQSGPLYLPPEKTSPSAAASAPGPGLAPPAVAGRPGALRTVPGRLAPG